MFGQKTSKSDIRLQQSYCGWWYDCRHSAVCFLLQPNETLQSHIIIPTLSEASISKDTADPAESVTFMEAHQTYTLAVHKSLYREKQSGLQQVPRM